MPHPRLGSTSLAVHHNTARLPAGAWPSSLEPLLPCEMCRHARASITRWEGYQPSPLRHLGDLAARCGVADIAYKDEAGRFSLGSFKALGGAYGVLRVLADVASRQRGEPVPDTEVEVGRLPEAAGVTVATASDGNHGRSVAWGARRFGCRCVVYLHRNVSTSRAEAIEALGAHVTRVAGNYDDAVRQATNDTRARGWHLVADTAADIRAATPRQVMAGYTTIVAELVEQLPRPATHVVVQGGVGGLAAAVTGELWRRLGAAMPRIVVVEPELAACLSASARAGAPSSVQITAESVMAGLSCGEVSRVAWPILEAGVADFVTIPDRLIAPVMTRLVERSPEPIVAGESAVAGLAAVLEACGSRDHRRALAMDATSRVVVFGTEGATDPGIFRSLTGIDPRPSG